MYPDWERCAPTDSHVAKDVVGDLRSKSGSLCPSHDADVKHSGIQSLSESNRDKATHREIIGSMNK